MITRVTASFVLVAFSAVLVSPQVFARGAGSGFAGIRAPSPPVLRAHPPTPSVVQPGRAVPSGRGMLPSHALQGGSFAHRARWGNGAWSGRQWYDTGYESGYYGPYDYGAYGYDGPYYGGNDLLSGPPQPAYPAAGYPVGGGASDPAPKIIHVLPYRPGCDTQTEKVHGKNGEHYVRIVRC